MSSKSRRKETVRIVQELTGRSYQSAHNLIESWKAAGLNVQAEIVKLAWAKGAP